MHAAVQDLGQLLCAVGFCAMGWAMVRRSEKMSGFFVVGKRNADVVVLVGWILTAIFGPAAVFFFVQTFVDLLREHH